MRNLASILRALGLVLIAFIACIDFGDGESEGCDVYENKCEGVYCTPDGNECTRDCNPSTGACDYKPREDGWECNFEGGAGVCIDGVCEEDPCGSVVCDDDNQCTDDLCDWRDGSCSYPPRRDGASCDFDGVPGVCVDAACQDNACNDVVCDDQNECTYDDCDPVTGCITDPLEDGIPCNDGGGACLNGVCKLHPCDPVSEEVLQCPMPGFEQWFCCPGSHLCQQSCRT